MSQSKEFKSKSLDEAIQEACDFYGVVREKLEIEILSDAKSGIFGLVGAKKATIRARKIQLPGVIAQLEKKAEQAAPAERGQRRQEAAVEADAGDKAAPGGDRSVSGGGKGFGRNARNDKSVAQPAASQTSGGRDERPKEAAGRSRPEKAQDTDRGHGSKDAEPALRQVRHGGGRGKGRDKDALHAERGSQESLVADAKADALDDGRDALPQFVLENCDRDALFTTVREVVLTLVAPVVGPVPCAVELAGKRIRVALDCGEASALLVGQDGQILAAVQYLATRMVSRCMGGEVRLLIDVGKYRERQDDRLRELALSLAARAKETGRPQSTRPLSAYQRRIVHLALEQVEAVTTHSKGEGPQRRVVVYFNQRNGAPRNRTELVSG